MRSQNPAKIRSTAAAYARSWCRGIVLGVALAGMTGCQLDRSFFQMDSNSRVPFFGVDLAPKWPRRNSSVDGVSRLQSEPVKVAASASPTPFPQSRSLALPQSDTVAPALHEADSGPVERFR